MGIWTVIREAQQRLVWRGQGRRWETRVCGACTARKSLLWGEGSMGVCRR